MNAHHTTADQRVQSARAMLVLDQPFFGVLALQLELQADPSCDTAWTNGRTLGYSPDYVSGLSDIELQGLIIHEVLHCACGHPWRRHGRDAKRFNVACDYAINGPIQDAGFTVPAGALLSPEYTGKYAEWIYDRLPQPSDPQPDPNGTPDPNAPQGTPDPNGSPDPNGQPGEVRDAPTDADAPSEDTWKQTVEQATRICQAQGTLPANMARALEHAKAPAVDWRSALRKYIQEMCASDYTWTRPNTRYLASGLFLPSLRAEQCGRMTVAVDTSGSIDTVLLSQFGSELQAIADDVHPASVQVIYCDSQVQHVDTFERGDPITVEPHGGGGTAFSPVFEHVDASGDVPAVLVYLTDLYGSFPDTAPAYPVIWAVTGDCDRPVPFGDVIRID